MKSFKGIIVAADATEKEITIKCPGGVSGAEMGREVILSPEWADNLDKKDFKELRKTTLDELRG